MPTKTRGVAKVVNCRIYVLNGKTVFGDGHDSPSTLAIVTLAVMPQQGGGLPCRGVEMETPHVVVLLT